MDKDDRIIIGTFVDYSLSVVERQPPPCDVIYDEVHESEYCRVCEIGSLLQLIKHELEELKRN